MRRGGFVVKHCNKRRVNSSIVLPVLFIIIFISGCVSHVKELRDAQDHFNTAASIENQVKTGDVSGERIVLKARANTSYHLALNTASDLLENKKQELQDDNLLGSAYSLKALSEWRIGNYPAAIATLGMLNRNPETQSQLFPRDMALIQALSGLIKNDQAALHMTAGDYEFESIITLLIEAVEDIDSGIALVKAGDEDLQKMCLQTSIRSRRFLAGADTPCLRGTHLNGRLRFLVKKRLIFSTNTGESGLQ
jgi:hypothetical protein